MADTIEQRVERIVVSIRPEEYPDSLYHYSTLSGCLGILESSTIWATDVRYLNDASEYEIAFRLAREILNIAPSDELSADREVRESLLERFKFQWSPFTYVASLSRKADQLSQWRAYSDGGGGVSLGFDVPTLLTVSNSEGFYLARCIYDETFQRKVLMQVRTEVIESAREREREGQSLKQVLHEAFVVFQSAFSFIAPTFKHASFHEESEWRLISQSSLPFEQKLKFRATRTQVVPYIALPIAPANQQPTFNRLIVGPSPHKDLTEHALALACQEYGVNYGTIDSSNIPYRNW